MSLFSNFISPVDMMVASSMQQLDVGGVIVSFLPFGIIVGIVSFVVARSRKRKIVAPCALPMKWYYFLTRFYLILGAIASALIGFQYIRGGDNAGYAPKIIDVCCGVVWIGLGAFFIYARQRLAKYKTDGPGCLIISLTLMWILGWIDEMLYAYTSANELSVRILLSMVVWGIFLFCNIKYFNKRKHLFVN